MGPLATGKSIPDGVVPGHRNDGNARSGTRPRKGEYWVRVSGAPADPEIQFQWEELIRVRS